MKGRVEFWCRRCGSPAHSDCTPMLAWCWPTGLIQIGEVMPVDGRGAIAVASGPASALLAALASVASYRHGTGPGTFDLVVPGVREVSDGYRALDALLSWVAWCRKRQWHDGVTFDLRGER